MGIGAGGGGAPYLVTMPPGSSTSPGSGGGLGVAVVCGLGIGSGFASVGCGSEWHPTAIAAAIARAAARDARSVGTSDSLVTGDGVRSLAQNGHEASEASTWRRHEEHGARGRYMRSPIDGQTEPKVYPEVTAVSRRNRSAAPTRPTTTVPYWAGVNPW